MDTVEIKHYEDVGYDNGRVIEIPTVFLPKDWRQPLSVGGRTYMATGMRWSTRDPRYIRLTLSHPKEPFRLMERCPTCGERLTTETQDYDTVYSWSEPVAHIRRGPPFLQCRNGHEAVSAGST